MSDQTHPEMTAMPSKAEIQPYGRRILIQDPPADQESGIIIPDSAQTLKRGIIVALPRIAETHHWSFFAVEPLRKEDDAPDAYAGLQVGEVVLYKPSCGEEINGQRLLDIDCVRAVER